MLTSFQDSTASSRIELANSALGLEPRAQEITYPSKQSTIGERQASPTGMPNSIQFVALNSQITILL